MATYSNAITQTVVKNFINIPASGTYTVYTMPDEKHGWVKLSHLYVPGVSPALTIQLTVQPYNTQTASYLSTNVGFGGAASDMSIQIWTGTPTSGAANILGVPANGLGNAMFLEAFDNSQDSCVGRVYLGPLDRVQVTFTGVAITAPYLHFHAVEYSA